MAIAKNILIIDDSRSVSAVLKKYLEDFGEGFEFSVLQAFNGFEGLRYCRGKRIDLILLDMVMPKMNGLQFLAHRMKNEKLKKVPVIVLSSVSKNEVVKQDKTLGANSYLLKHISMIRLKQAL